MRRYRALHQDSGFVWLGFFDKVAYGGRICPGPARRSVCFAMGITRLGLAVVASENGRRPDGVVTYQDTNVADTVAKWRQVTEPYVKLKCGLSPETGDDKSPRWRSGCCRIIEQWSDEPCAPAGDRRQSSRDTLRPACRRVNVEPRK